jgi:hypothetical protein
MKYPPDHHLSPKVSAIHFNPPSLGFAPSPNAPHFRISSNQLRRRIRRLAIGVGRPIKKLSRTKKEKALRPIDAT